MFVEEHSNVVPMDQKALASFGILDQIAKLIFNIMYKVKP
jgi:hypothetical protein